ncbi:MAG: hypothetical protein RLY20_3165 [Verrucomicrobiota bacterium]|jgi:hypothetical protein
MPRAPIEYVPRVFVPDQFRPDSHTLQAILERQGALQAQAALNAGQSRAGMWNQFGQLFAQYQNELQRRDQQAAVLAQRQAEQSAADKLKRDEMSEKKAERDEANRIRQEGVDRQNKLDAEKRGDSRAKAIGYGPMAETDVDTVMQSPDRSGDVRYIFGPNTANGPELMPTPDQQRGIQVEKSIQAMGGQIGPNGQVIMPPKPVSQRFYEVTVPGPKGPVRKLVTEEELRGGIQQYEKPDKPQTSLNLQGPYATAFSRAIMSAPAMKRAGLIQTANDVAARGSEDDLKGLIRQAAIEGENVDVKNQVIGRLTTIKALQDAKGMISEMRKAGIPTDILSGTAEDVARKLGKTTNPAYVKLGQNLQDVLINYRRAATGAQFGESEGKSYEKMFPKYTNDFPVNDALLDGLLSAMSNRDRTYWEYKLGPEGASLISASAPSATSAAKKDNPFRKKPQ